MKNKDIIEIDEIKPTKRPKNAELARFEIASYRVNLCKSFFYIPIAL